MMLMDTHSVAGTILKKADYGTFMLQKIADLEVRYGIRLGLAQKVLLAETGTVEQVLSILTNSTTKVKVVEQQENSRTINRRSVITNDQDKVLIKGYSKVFKRNLPAKVVRQIKRKEVGIGTIIASSGLETFRRIIEIGYDPASRTVFRKYQIICMKRVAFEIREELVGMEGPAHAE